MCYKIIDAVKVFNFIGGIANVSNKPSAAALKYLKGTFYFNYYKKIDIGNR